jgi:HK97 family phage prohead protease
MAQMEIRTVATALRAASSAEFKLEGTACSYNALSKDLGGFVERIAPGAFSRSLASGEDVICTFNHSPDKVLGRLKNGTLKLKDSPDSLNFSCQLNRDSQEHRDLYSSVKRGDISERSFAFAIDNDGGRGEEFEDVRDASGNRTTLRTITAAHLFDVSAVTNPAYGNGATNVNARQFRSCDYAATRQTTQFVQHVMQTPKQIDLENQKRLLAIGTMICRDPYSNALIEDFELRQKADKLAGVIERGELAEKFAELRRELEVE